MEDNIKKVVFEAEGHSNHVCRTMCNLLEKQYLVDITITCGINTVCVHKFMLAANSGYFKEQLRNKNIEQVVINGLDFSVMKSLIEYMYSGQCVFPEPYLSQVIAAAKFFKIASLETLFAEKKFQKFAADEVCIVPKFLCTPPKFATSTPTKSSKSKINPASNNGQGQQKCFGGEVDKACAKEAEASRITMADEQKLMQNISQPHVVDKNTVENFVPLVENSNAKNFVSSNEGFSSEKINLSKDEYKCQIVANEESMQKTDNSDAMDDNSENDNISSETDILQIFEDFLRDTDVLPK